MRTAFLPSPNRHATARDGGLDNSKLATTNYIAAANTAKSMTDTCNAPFLADAWLLRITDEPGG